jgi:uncharacterized protein YbjT (DUF2867 family)
MVRVLVVGANGKTGRHVVAALQARKEPLFIRGLGRTPITIEGVEAVQGDLEVPADRARAVEGMDAVIHYAPSMHPRETAMGTGMIDAAVAAKVKLFVYISVIHPQIDDLLNHQAKLAVESYLIDTDLDWTILRPQHYMQNLDVPRAIESGQVMLPTHITAVLAHVDMADLAEAAAKVALEPGHRYAAYDISGSNSDDLSTEQISAVISRIAQRPIAAREGTAAQFVAVLTQGHTMTNYATEATHRLSGYYARRGIKGNPNVLTWLLGRAPTSFDAYVTRCVETMNANSSRT